MSSNPRTFRQPVFRSFIKSSFVVMWLNLKLLRKAYNMRYVFTALHNNLLNQCVVFK